MGMVAVYQQVAPAMLARLVAKPDLLEDFLFAERDDSYAVDGYGDLSVDVGTAGMSSWEEIDRRVRSLVGEVRLRDGSRMPAKGVEITRQIAKWRDSAGPHERPHAAIASLRLVPPLSKRMVRAWHRTGEFVVSVAFGGLFLTLLYLHLQKTHGLPPWVLGALLLAGGGAVLAKAILVFARERVVVAYRHRRARRAGPSKPEPIDIDKSWEPIGAALAEFDHPDAATFRLAVLGGREIEGSEVDLGPARYLCAEEVAAVASAFSRVSATAFADRCATDLRDYVALHFRNLQDYYRDAATHGHAMICYFC